ncbi:MAG: hypothetical protein ACK56I_27245, partial [bacterium]
VHHIHAHVGAVKMPNIFIIKFRTLTSNFFPFDPSENLVSTCANERPSQIDVFSSINDPT